MVAINMTKPVQVQAKTLKLHLKVRDEFAAGLCDQNGEEIFDYEGYVPDFMPGNHYGDYVIFDIDLDTGQITNWKPPTAKQIEAWMAKSDDD